MLEPDTGALASGLSSKGRFPEIDEIVEALRRLLVPTRDLTGERLLVATGRRPNLEGWGEAGGSGAMLETGSGTRIPERPRRAELTRVHAAWHIRQRAVLR